MAAAGRGAAGRVRSVRDRLLAEPFAFDFFQAVRLLERLAPGRAPVGAAFSAPGESARFRPHLTLAFPPSAVHALALAEDDGPPLLTVTFLGLYGTTGTLPRHYTQLLLDTWRDVRGPERTALRDWLDVFNHRAISLFYRAWEKYRPGPAFERAVLRPDNVARSLRERIAGPATGALVDPGALEPARGASSLRYPARTEPDPFTAAVLSVVGLGGPGHRGRLRVAAAEPDAPPVARLDDQGLLYFAGFFAQRPRNPASLCLMAADTFGVPVDVRPFVGQWLVLPPDQVTVLGGHGTLGTDAFAGDRVWDVKSRFRVRVGPLSASEFAEFLPDPAPVTERKAVFLLAQLVRLFVGADMDFDVQLVLRADAVPDLALADGPGLGPHLGWNTWLLSGPPPAAVDDPVFDPDTFPLTCT